jgi:type VI secretion system protein
MALKIRVISDHYKALGKRSSCLFGVTGGRIGRSQSNDWILPDPDRYISSHHCAVQFRAGSWILEDTSTNGVFVNGANTPASVDGPYTLQDGDRLRLGDYELLVSIDERGDFPADASGQMPVPARTPKSKPLQQHPEDLGEELDITDLLSDASFDKLTRPDAKGSHVSDLEKELGLEMEASTKLRSTSKATPAPTAKQGGFDSLLGTTGDTGERTPPSPPVLTNKADDWQMQTRPYDRKTMTVLPTGAVVSKAGEGERPRRAGESNGDLQAGVEAFCRGAGIDPNSLPGDTQAALLTLAGQTLREVVLGLMEAHKSRTDLRNRLHLGQGSVAAGENNPLKTSTSVDEAVRRLLDAQHGRFQGPIEAIRSSFADLQGHQKALAAATQSATDELMSRIEPGELQERFDRGLKRSPLLGAANKMKYWDLYVEFYQVLNQRNGQGLPPLFAEELARAYAEEIDQSRLARKKTAK